MGRGAGQDAPAAGRNRAPADLPFG